MQTNTDSRTTFDTIVVGLGGIGSATLYWLSRRLGGQVLGIEQFDLGHPFGGSQDHSRIIRHMYHDARYTALTPHTYHAWAETEEESGVQVVLKTGGLEFANADYAHDIQRYADAMAAAGLPFERLSVDEVRYRYPQFRLQDDVHVLWDPVGGLVDAAKGNAVHIALARRHGAGVRSACHVQAVEPSGDGVVVRTAHGDFSARRVVVTAAAWTNHVLAATGLTLPLTVTQEQVTYYATSHLKEFSPERFPIFIWKDQLDIYGFPVYGEVATKVGVDASGPVVTPETRSLEPDPVREAAITDWLRAHIPNFVGPVLYSKTCLYTMPPDRDFIIDRVPGAEQILVCVGAGHAYKFAGLLGKILSQLTVDGQTEYPVDSFTLQRPAIQDPAYVAAFHI